MPAVEQFKVSSRIQRTNVSQNGAGSYETHFLTEQWDLKRPTLSQGASLCF